MKVRVARSFLKVRVARSFLKVRVARSFLKVRVARSFLKVRVARSFLKVRVARSFLKVRVARSFQCRSTNRVDSSTFPLSSLGPPLDPFIFSKRSSIQLLTVLLDRETDCNLDIKQ